MLLHPHQPSYPPLFNLSYEPLDEDKKEIRVLRLLNMHSSDLMEDKIQCRIEHVSLKDPPVFPSISEHPDSQENFIFWGPFTECIDFRESFLERTEISKAASIARAHNIVYPNFRYTWGGFEALSYTWGNKKDTKEITVNGVDINVPKNLEEALKTLRDLEETRLGMSYWVDSLCINQNCEDEKEIQVKRMKDIYNQARAVVVWLVQAEAQDKLAAETMHYLCQNPCVKESLGLPEDLLLLDGGLALLAFMRNTYWTRLWIIQELAMNHNSTLILCGRYMLTRRMIRLGAIYCQHLLEGYEELCVQSDPNLDFGAWPMVSRVYRLMSLVFNPKSGVNLNRLLSLVRRAEASIEKDKVYSIIGLLDPAISQDIEPDYSKSVSEQQVYTNFVVFVVKKSTSLQQIMFGGIPTTEGWPSWVADWRKPFGRHHLQYSRCSKASGKLPANFRFIENGENRLLLVCGGFRVDEVDGVAAESSTSWHSRQSSKFSNRYGEHISGALQRTLLMNHPIATRKRLLKIPWVSKCDTSIQPANFPSNSRWPKLFESSYAKKFNAFRERSKDFAIGGRSFRSFFPQTVREDVDMLSAQRCLRLATISLEQRALITTKTGYLGMAPFDVCPGDAVAILLGMACPVVLRPRSNGHYQIVGECYIHGLMNGEILSQASENKIVKQEFVLC